MRRVSRLVLRHRRVLSALCVALAVWLALTELGADPPGERVVVAADDLPSGHVLTRADLRTSVVTQAPSRTVDAGDLVGRTVAAPMRAGEPFTDVRLAGPDLLAALGDGTVLATVRVADPESLAALGVGDDAVVVASDPHGEAGSRVVTREARIVSLPPPRDGAVVVGLGVDEATALSISSASLRGPLSLLAVG